MKKKEKSENLKNIGQKVTIEIKARQTGKREEYRKTNPLKKGYHGYSGML